MRSLTRERLLPTSGTAMALALSFIMGFAGISPLASLPAHSDEGSSAMNSTVTIAAGAINGTQLSTGVLAFKGIPYATAPVGELRWKPPQQPKPWTGVKSTQRFGPPCPQPADSRSPLFDADTASEDCLYLNIWTPAKKAGDKLPVMVWIHGGGFISDTASQDFYSGERLALKDVVVVNFNYRIGPLGFLAHPLLSKESEHNVSGNYGLLDQIAALKWVKENISAFGGDPDRVTLFGESAGGRSVAHLLVSPLADSLFHGAIMESSSTYRPIQHIREQWYGRPAMEKVGEDIARQLGSAQAEDPIADMRSKSVEALFDVAKPRLPGMSVSSNDDSDNGYPFEPIADGWVIPDDPGDLFDKHKAHKVPVIVGSNADEGTLFLRKAFFMTTRRARASIDAAYPKYGDKIAAAYELEADDTEPKQVLNLLSGDMNCAAPMRSIARNMVSSGNTVWLYYFSYVRNDFLGKRLGAWHGSEIRFVMNSLDNGKAKVEPRDRQMAEKISSYWTNFAKTGNPNGPGLPQWPKFSIASGDYLELNETVVAKQNLRKDTIDLVAEIEVERRKNRRSQ
ncbi:Fumonisin B1 esterase [Halioglobus japonicus]|nr:Fumonisin B1 esterase [Halioglobus japonicus]